MIACPVCHKSECGCAHKPEANSAKGKILSVLDSLTPHQLEHLAAIADTMAQYTEVALAYVTSEGAAAGLEWSRADGGTVVGALGHLSEYEDAECPDCGVLQEGLPPFSGGKCRGCRPDVCDTCKGTGQVPDGSECPMCDGTGVV